MSHENSENIDVVRLATAAFNRGGFDDVVDRFALPEYEWHSAEGVPGGGAHRGREAVKSFVREYLGSWRSYSLEEEQLVEVGDRVLALVHVRAEGKASGVVLDVEVAYVHTLRDGRLLRTDVFFDRQSAFEAVGLKE
jgi:ketosteroid isomerase-like protein